MRTIKAFLIKIIYHYSTYLTSWSWQKLYKNKNSLGYKKGKKQYENNDDVNHCRLNNYDNGKE